MLLWDTDHDEWNELIVGSEDNFIRVYKNEYLLFEIIESSKPI